MLSALTIVWAVGQTPAPPLIEPQPDFAQQVCVLTQLFTPGGMPSSCGVGWRKVCKRMASDQGDCK